MRWTDIAHTSVTRAATGDPNRKYDPEEKSIADVRVTSAIKPPADDDSVMI
jgi:hypothetical protein